jgi:hypothetical protein
MPSAVDKRRLKDGQEALELGTDLPTDLGELQTLRDQLHDGVAALQSTDDLGSEAANQAAWDDMLELQRRYDRVVKKIKKLEKKS